MVETAGRVPLKHPYKSLRWAAWRLLDIEDVAHPGTVYLRRRIIFKTPLLSLYLHRIYQPDGDRWPHNHPFAFLSLVLRGGYREIVYKDAVEAGATSAQWLVAGRHRRRFSLAATRRSAFHRIVSLDHPATTTLVLAGPSRRSWGFLTDAGYRPFDLVD